MFIIKFFNVTLIDFNSHRKDIGIGVAKIVFTEIYIYYIFLSTYNILGPYLWNCRFYMN